MNLFATMAEFGCPKDAKHCSLHPSDIAENDRDYYLERKYPSFGNLAPLI